jgi:hypothetical protein
VTITETDRFDVLSFYYDMGNLTIITTHNVNFYSFFENSQDEHSCLFLETR